MLDYNPTVTVVSEDTSLHALVEALVRERGYQPLVLADSDEALQCFRVRPPAAVVLDVTRDGASGLSALRDFNRIDRGVPVLVVSGQGQPALVVQAMRGGAADFLCKPIEREQLRASLERALSQHRLNAELAAMRIALAVEPPYRVLSAEEGRMADISRLIDGIADNDSVVLVRGEAGSGKELVARAIHARSTRRERPFLKVNCSSPAGPFLEAELFGCERGAAPGALQHRPGRLEFANHGTLFLNEVAALASSLQSRLLQVLRDGEFARPGRARPVCVDARIIASTSRDLEAAAAEGSFSQDLLARLSAIVIQLPSLREHREEIPLLTDYFLTKFSVHYNQPRPRLSSDTVRLFEEHQWPGNVDELADTVRRLVVDGTEAQIQRELQRARARELPAIASGTSPEHGDAATAASAPVDAPVEAPSSRSLKVIAREAARQAERAAIALMLQRTRWNRKEAAEILGISYKALLYKIKENGLDKPSPTQ